MFLLYLYIGIFAYSAHQRAVISTWESQINAQVFEKFWLILNYKLYKMVFSDKEKIWIVEEGARKKSAVVDYLKQLKLIIF